MDFSTWLLFCAVASIAALTPGPGVLLAVSNSVAHGSRGALVSAFGNMTGLFIVSGTVMAGLGTLLQASATAFLVLKVCGAAYLIYLGIRQWRSRTNVFAQAGAADAAPRDRKQLFLQGILVALTNPKSVLFFGALFPQFVATGTPVLPQFLILTATFAACAMLSHMMYALLARGTKRWFAVERRAALFNRFTGGAFMALGIGMLRLKRETA